MQTIFNTRAVMRTQISRLSMTLASWLLLTGAAAHAQADVVKAPDNFISWRAGLSSAAQPSRHYLEQAAQLKYDLLINLAPPQSWGSLENEGALIAKHGLAYE